jgi:hypothetical protein
MNNVPAFPSPGHVGMTLRDYIAVGALHSVGVLDDWAWDGCRNLDRVALLCCQVADAFLLEREKTND